MLLMNRRSRSQELHLIIYYRIRPHAPTNLSSHAAPTSSIQDIVLQQSYRASTNPANQDHMIQGTLKFKNLQAVDEVDKYRNKAIKGKDIVREENTKPKDKKKDGTIHPKS